MVRPKKAKWTEILGEQVVRVPGTSGRKKSRLPGHLVAGIVFTLACALFSGWVHVQSITTRYRVSRMLRVRTNLTQQRDTLEIEKQMLCSPNRITRLAVETFGMHLPGEEERVILE